LLDIFANVPDIDEARFLRMRKLSLHIFADSNNVKNNNSGGV